MPMPINPISPPTLISPPTPITTAPSAAGDPKNNTFSDFLSSAVANVSAATDTANAAAQDFLAGGTHELHSTILASQAAELDFELLMQVRNKVVSAYEEIMKMQI